MDRSKSSYRELRRYFDQYRQTAIPRNGALIAIDDCAIDMYEEDGYLAGLTKTFLDTRKISISEISLDQSIESQLATIVPNNDVERETLDAFVRYRNLMLRLAKSFPSKKIIYHQNTKTFLV